MAGILHQKNFKRLVSLLLILALLQSVFVLFAVPAEAAPVTITLEKASEGEYKFMSAQGYSVNTPTPVPSEFVSEYVPWDFVDFSTPTKPSTGPFYFVVAYNTKKFTKAQVNVYANDSGGTGATGAGSINVVGETASFDAGYGNGLEKFPIYELTGVERSIRITVVLKCLVTLTIRDTLEVPGYQEIFPATGYTVETELNASFKFVVRTREFFMPKVYVNPDMTGTDYNQNQPDAKFLDYSKLEVGKDFPNQNFWYTYDIPKVTGNVEYFVNEIVGAYVVQFPRSQPDIYVTVPSSLNGEYYAVEFFDSPPPSNDFSFNMYFTEKYGDSEPHASIVGNTAMKITTAQLPAASAWKVTVPQPDSKRVLVISFNDKNWDIILKGVTIQENATFYSCNPENHYIRVSYDDPAIFYLIPTPAYAANTNAPDVTSTSGYSVKVEREGAQWKCTIPGVKTTLDVKVNVSTWVADPSIPTGEIALVTLPSGEGYSIGNITGGTGVGNNQYQVRKSSDFSFSVNVGSGYDPTTLNVSVAGQRLFPDNGVYTIPQVNANLTVTIKVDKLSTSTPTPSTSPGSTNGSGNGGKDDGELKYHEVYDEKTGIMVAGFFMGKPEIVVTDLFKTDPVYIRMLNTAAVADEKVLRAVDVQIKNATSYGTITLGLHVGVGYNTIEMLVVHATSTGDETFTVLGQDGMAQVSVRHTSPFMVADPYGRGPGNTGSGNGTGSGNNILPPATGDLRSIMGFVLVGVVIVSILFILWYRLPDDDPKKSKKKKITAE